MPDNELINTNPSESHQDENSPSSSLMGAFCTETARYIEKDPQNTGESHTLKDIAADLENPKLKEISEKIDRYFGELATILLKVASENGYTRGSDSLKHLRRMQQGDAVWSNAYFDILPQGRSGKEEDWVTVVGMKNVEIPTDSPIIDGKRDERSEATVYSSDAIQTTTTRHYADLGKEMVVELDSERAASAVFISKTAFEIMEKHFAEMVIKKG